MTSKKLTSKHFTLFIMEKDEIIYRPFLVNSIMYISRVTLQTT